MADKLQPNAFKTTNSHFSFEVKFQSKIARKWTDLFEFHEDCWTDQDRIRSIPVELSGSL